MKNFKIKPASANSVQIKILTDELHKELELIYGKGIIEEFIDENEQMLIFYVAYDESGNAAACGALKHFNDQTAEIKRMYVKPEYSVSVLGMVPESTLIWLPISLVKVLLGKMEYKFVMFVQMA